MTQKAYADDRLSFNLDKKRSTLKIGLALLYNTSLYVLHVQISVTIHFWPQVKMHVNYDNDM